MERFDRARLIIGDAGMTALSRARVAVFGVGGVGGALAEALARTGVGAIDLIDNDVVDITNINRQTAALSSTVGKYKTDVMRDRLLDVNPRLEVNVVRMFYLPQTADGVDLTRYTYIADAMDTVAAKVELVCRAAAAGVPVISACGAGNKRDPSRFEIADIYDTSVCPLARALRIQLKKRGIASLDVVYSKEPPLPGGGSDGRTPGSLAFVVPVAGLLMAGRIINAITGAR